MKQRIIIVLCLCFSLFMSADEAKINLEHKNGGNHIEHYAPADLPEVYHDDETDEITIVADGFSSYYNVVIIRNTPYQVVITTQVSGYGDVIDVSALSSGSYTIVITTEFLNEYEGQFTI